MTGHTVGIDLGGTHVRAALVTDDGTVQHRTRRRTPSDDPGPDVLVELIDEVATAAHTAPERAVVGIPGVIDHDADELVRAPNIPQRWIPALTGARLSASAGLDVTLANDADLAAVGEAAFGAGRRYRDVVYVTISTGVGAGIVVDRTLVRGRNSGGEIGHTVVDLAAARRGEPATVEELGAGPAIARAAAAAGIDERDAALADLVRGGDATAVALWNDAIEAVGFGIVNVAWLVAPQVVVVGGGVGANTELVLPVIDRVLAANGPAVDEPIAVVGAELGDDVALAGAAAWFGAVGRQQSGEPVGVIDG